MKELFYFSNSDVMVQIEYSETDNLLHYTSHRRITDREREIIEQYIKNHVVSEIEDHANTDATSLNYAGIDAKLTYNLDQFHLEKSKTTREEPNINEAQVEKTVQDLIQSSMQKYYFEKIGEMLLSLRKAYESADDIQISGIKHDLAQLVDAYNSYSNQKVDLTDILAS